MRIWPFKRRKNDALPEEVQEYYQSTSRERTGVAWLLAAGTLVATIVLAVVLFFGGRTIYRLFTDDKKPESTAQVQNTNQDKSSTSKPTDDANKNQDSTSTDKDQVAIPSDDVTDGTPATDQSPATGPSTPTEVPDTGPGPGGLQ